jgi:hypothetical protein
MMKIKAVTKLAFLFSLVFSTLPDRVNGQILGLGREHVELTRTRPADVHLVNQTLQVKVTSLDPAANHLTERLQKILANGVLGAGKNLREVPSAPQILVECTVTRYAYNEKTEEKKMLLVKDKGTYKIITFTLEVSYRVLRTRDNTTLFGNTLSLPYKKEFQVGVETAPGKAELEDNLMRLVIQSVLEKLTNTDEKLKVRLMGKGDLDVYTRLAQGGQWLQFIESISALPERKPDKDGRSEFEGDRNYSMAIAYEALAYETMWKDYGRAEKYYDLADTAIRKAQQFDPREKEYVNAQNRMLTGKKYFETIKERFPKLETVAKVETQPAPRDLPNNPPAAQPPKPASPNVPAASNLAPVKPSPDTITNDDVIKMLQANMSESIIIDTIRTTKNKQFDTSATGLIQLHQAGASEKLIKYIQSLRQPRPSKRRGN